MKILVTGATGFVGSHCLEELAKIEGVEVIAACRRPAALPKGFTGEVRMGDMRDETYLRDAITGVDTILHAAAWSALWGSAQRSKALYFDPSQRFMRLAKAQGVKRFVFISTTSAPAVGTGSDPLSKGKTRGYWPHEASVVALENELRTLADADFCAVNLRLGLFVGARYSLGLLPILVPRLKTHLVPWVAGGHTQMPLVDGRDIGAAGALAATVDGLNGFEGFTIVGPEVPSLREVLTYLHDRYGLPKPHFSVPFVGAFTFAWLMEKLNPVVPWEPLVTRSIIHLMQNTDAHNTAAQARLGYVARHPWQQAVDIQMAEMQIRQKKPMRMALAEQPFVRPKR